MQIFLRVPYEQRRHAKSRGAHWCKSKKLWYVIDTVSFRRCYQWFAGEITEEIKAWLDDPLRAKYFPDTPAPARQTSAREDDRLLRVIKSAQKEARDARHLYVQKQKWKGKLKTGSWRNAARKPAGPFSGSSTEIRSVTVKLPL